MIIDFILERKDGQPYNARKFYYYILNYWSTFSSGLAIADALDSGEEADVKQALCDYITDNDYNPNIIDYINTVQWL